MSSFRIRPRFKLISDEPKEKIEQKIIALVKNKDSNCIAKKLPGFIILKIPEEDSHFWSPELSLTFENKENSTIIRGLYGPRPTIWSFFSFGYIGLAVFFFFASIFGLAQVGLNQDAPVLWLLPIFTLMALVIYLIAQFGQKVGVEQTFRLHYFFEEAVGTKVHIS